MSSEAYELTNVGFQAQILSSQWSSEVNISSNIPISAYSTNPYISYSFENQNNLLLDSGKNNRHLINYGGIYNKDGMLNCLLLQSSNYALVPSEDWSIYNDLSISFSVKTIDSFINNVSQFGISSFFNDTTNLQAWYKFDDAIGDQHPTITMNSVNQTPIWISGNTYYHTFTSSGSIVFPQNTTCDVLLIGGGGGGSTANGEGGGAGAMIVSMGYTFTAGTYNVTVGSGGIGARQTGGNLWAGGRGGDSSIGSLFVAKGGGGADHTNVLTSGGCSAGFGATTITTAVQPVATNTVNGITNQGPQVTANYAIYGTAGGRKSENWSTNNYDHHNTPGGGGIGQAGQDATNANPGNGGNGLATITLTGGSPITLKDYFSPNSAFGVVHTDGKFYIGGGGGGSKHNTGTQGLGGLGGGGNARQDITTSDSGVTNTGSGGGGRINNVGGSGGSGIVIIRYTLNTSLKTAGTTFINSIQSSSFTNMISTIVGTGADNYIVSNGNDNISGGIKSLEFTGTGTTNMTYLSTSSSSINIRNSIYKDNGLTISFWIKLNTLGNFMKIFSHDNIYIQKNSSGTSSGDLIITFNNSNSITAISGLTATNKWEHWTFTFKYVNTTTGNFKFYKNGVLANSVNGFTWNETTATSKFAIGGFYNNSTSSDMGNTLLDDFRIYNKELLLEDIYKLYMASSGVTISSQTNNLKLLEFGDIFYDDTTNIVIWYKFNNSASEMLLDYSGSSLNAVSANNPIFDNVNYKTGNGSIYLNGSTQYVELPSSIDPFQIWNNGYGITFSVWFKMSNTSGTWAKVLDFSDQAVGTAAQNWIMISKNNTTTQIYFEINSNNGTKTNFIPTTSYIDNNWHHLVWSISSSGIWTIWIDNILQVLSGTGNTGTLTGTYPKMIPANVTWVKRWIGRSGTSVTDGAYIGNISDFRIYNKTLNNFEVNTLYTMGDNIIIKKQNNKLQFQINSTTVCETPYLDNTWNNIIWNIDNSSSNQGYVEINNKPKLYFNQMPLTPVSIQYPPYSLTGYENTFNGYTYRACSYSVSSAPWQAFDRSTTSRFTDAGSFTSGVLSAAGASFGNDTNYKGSYLGIDMGQPIVLDYYRIVQASGLPGRRPKHWRIYATNNDACWNSTGSLSSTPGFNTGPEYNWVQIDVRYNETQYLDTSIFYVNKTVPYRYYALNANMIISSDTNFDISEWQIFGYNPSVTIQQYPPVSMTGFSTTYAGITYQTCSYDYYIVDSSFSWKAFDRNNTTRFTTPVDYDINGILNITGVSFGNDTSYKGVYLGIDMGQSFVMKYYYIIEYLFTRKPRNWKIYATNDSRCWNSTGGTNITPSFNTGSEYSWTQIDVRANEITYTNATRFILDNNTPYRYYAFHVNALIGGTASGGNNFDIYEWQIFGYPYNLYTNRLGSTKNQGLLYFNDFKIHNTPLITYDEDKLYDITDFINTNGLYTLDYQSGVLLSSNVILPCATTSWNTSNDITYSTWIKTNDIQNGDVIFESVENDIVTITANMNNFMIPNNLTNMSFNYGSLTNILAGFYNISFTDGAIICGNTTDRSYPILTTYSTSNTISPFAIYANSTSNINIINPYLWYKFDSNQLTVDSGLANINLSTIGTGGTVNTTTFVKGNASVYFSNSTANYFRTNTIITKNVPLSICFWFRIPSGNQNTLATMVSYSNSTAPFTTGNISIRFDYQGSTAPANKLVVKTALNTQWTAQPTSTTSIAMDTWYHVVYTLDDANSVNARLYINGVLENTATSSTANQILPNIGYFAIGSAGDNTTGFVGFIDDFRFYTFALNQSQVSELYKGRVIFYNTRSIRLWKNNNLLEFQNNGSSVGVSTLDSNWNHILWNVSSRNNANGYIRINNGTKTNVNKFVTNMPLLRYPPEGMTGPVTNISTDIYGYNGGFYTVSASSFSSLETHWKAFNYDNSTDASNNYWSAISSLYSATTGAYLGSTSTIVSGSVILGEWLQLQLPIAIVLNNYNIFTRSGDLSRGPKTFKIAGSNDGIIWSLVNAQTSITNYTAAGKSFTVSNNTLAYTFYRLIIESNNNNIELSIVEWELYGFPLYPFTNTLGSLNNKGTIYLSNFNIITNSMTTNLEDQLYNTIPTDPITVKNNLVYNNIKVVSDEIRVYNTDYVSRPYLQYDFKNQSTLSLDSSLNGKCLSVVEASYNNEYGKNSLLLKNASEALIPSDNWNNYSNLTISTWFKTDGFKNGDEIIDFYQDPSISIQIEQYVKYPREAMTADLTTSATSRIITQVKTSATPSTGAAWNLFNQLSYVTDTTILTLGTYSTSTGIVSGATFFSGYAGQAILIDLNVNIILKQIRLFPRNGFLERAPGLFRIYATNTVANFTTPSYTGWDLIHDQTTQLTTSDYVFGMPTIVNINNNASYRVYALVVNKLAGTGANANTLSFLEMELYGKEINYTTPPIVPIQISGGDYYYAFTNPNIVYNMTVLQDITCDLLVVGGGGGGSSGGGGAGQFRYLSSYTLSKASYNIIVGNGGEGATGTNNGAQGQHSIINNGISDIIISYGGGGGGGNDVTNPTYTTGKVGSLGGTGNNITSTSGTTTNGNIGGFAAISTNCSGGGGGGAGGIGNNSFAVSGLFSVGTTSPYYRGGQGGIGSTSTIRGKLEYFAGGGTAGTFTNASTDTNPFIEVLGGGGTGSLAPNANGTAGTPNTGGGGGGGDFERTSGASGGSGIIIMRLHNGIKITENANNQLTIYVNNKSVHNTTDIVDGKWNHMILNLKNNASTNSFVKFNNGPKINITNYLITKYPKVAATANSYSYTNGTNIIISGSSRIQEAETYFYTFDSLINTGGWCSSYGYDASTGIPNISAYKTGYAGEYIQIDLGESIVLKYYNVYSRIDVLDRAPKSFRIYASNNISCWTDINHSSWTLLDEQINLSAYVPNIPKTFTLNNNNAYRYYVMIINAVFPNPAVSSMVQIGEWELYGYHSIFQTNFINKLGSIANIGNLYLSDFRIITDQLTSNIENSLFSSKLEYNKIVDEEYVTTI